MGINHGKPGKKTKLPIIIECVDVIIKHSFDFHALGFTENICSGTRLFTKIAKNNQSVVYIDSDFSKMNLMITIYVPFISILGVRYNQLCIDVEIESKLIPNSIVDSVKVIHVGHEILNLFGKNKDITDDFIKNLNIEDNSHIYNTLLNGIIDKVYLKYQMIPEPLKQIDSKIPFEMKLDFGTLHHTKNGPLVQHITIKFGNHKHYMRRILIKEKKELIEKLKREINHVLEKEQKININFISEHFELFQLWINHHIDHYFELQQ